MHLSYLKDYRYYLASALTSWRLNRGRRDTVKSILYIRLDRIGDALLSLPVLENMHLNWPDAEIDVLVNLAALGVYEDIPFLRQRFGYRSGRYEENGDLALPSELNGRQYDAIIDIRGDETTLAYARKIRPLFRMDDGGLRLKYVLRHKLGRRPRDYHELDFNLQLLERFGISLKEKKIKPYFGETEVSPEIQKLAGEEYAVIHPAAGWRFREWPADRYLEIIEHCREKGLRVLLTGPVADEKLKEIEATVATPHLRDLFFLLKNARLFVGSDSGPLHLTAVAGTPVVGLYGPNKPEWFGPVTDKKICHYKGVACSPCDQRGCLYGHPRCMQAIGAEEVIRSVDTLLEETA